MTEPTEQAEGTARERRRMQVLLLVLVAVLLGLGVASTAIWVADAAGPTRTVSAVITRNERTENPRSGDGPPRC